MPQVAQRGRIGAEVDTNLLSEMRDLWVNYFELGRYYVEPEWDMMQLRPDRLYIPPREVMTYAKQEIDPSVRAWHFTSTTKLVPIPDRERFVSYYVDDTDLAGVLQKPYRHAAEWDKEKVAGVVMPNFSVYTDYRIAERLWRRDRAYAISRFFQECGLNILPDVDWADIADFDWLLKGLPAKIPALMLQAQKGAKRKKMLMAWFKEGADELFKQIEVGTVYLYCPLPLFEPLSAPYRDRAEWIHVPTYREVRRWENEKQPKPI